MRASILSVSLVACLLSLAFGGERANAQQAALPGIPASAVEERSSSFGNDSATPTVTPRASVSADAGAFLGLREPTQRVVLTLDEVKNLARH